MHIKRFEDLLVWQKFHELVKGIYTEIKLPSEEKYGIESQIKRAVVSIPANIAEGSKRRHSKELIHFLNIALGSLSEVRYYLILCKDLGFLAEEQYIKFINNCIEIDKMLESLIYKIKNK